MRSVQDLWLSDRVQATRWRRRFDRKIEFRAPEAESCEIGVKSLDDINGNSQQTCLDRGWHRTCVAIKGARSRYATGIHLCSSLVSFTVVCMRQPTLKNPEKEPEIQTTQQVASVQFRDSETVYLECSWEHHGVGQAQEKAPGAISSGEGGK